MLDQQLIDIEDFRGLYRWYNEDTVPQNAFKDCLNLEFIPGAFNTRDGLTKTGDTEGGGGFNVLRIHRFEIPGEPDRELVLTNGGVIWDGNPGGVNILNVTGMTDFSMVSLYGRAYISPHNGEEGLEDTPIYVYDPSVVAMARVAGGDPPSDFSLTVANQTPTVANSDVVAPVAPANGAMTLTTTPYVPPTPSTLKFTITGGAVTAETFTIVGLDAAMEPQTKTYVDKIKSAGPVVFTTFDVWGQIDTITVSGLIGAGGTWKIEVTGQPPGKIEAGYHIIAVAYETDSGFITAPGPASSIGTNYNVFFTKKGKRALLVSGIPATLPAGVVKVHLLSSKAIPKKRYTGNPDEYELFFIPDTSGGIIDAGTTSSVINFFDADLVDSADFLKDNMSQIPAGVAILATSKGRLLVAGVNSTSVVGDESTDDDLANNTVIFGSKGGEPESFSKTDGFVIVKPGGEGIRNLAEYRSLIYAYKDTRTYVTQDNGGLPVEWEINSVDDAIGSSCHGVSIALGSDSASEDSLIVASRSGLQLFDGTYAERPLTWGIRELWDHIVAEDNFKQIEVALDPVNKFIFIAVPFDVDDYDNGFLLHGNYSDGLAWDRVKWCPWVFYNANGPMNPTTIYTKFDGSIPIMRLGSSDFNLYQYQYRLGLDTDDLNARDAFFESAKLVQSPDGGVTQINGVRMAINGPAQITVELIGTDSVNSEVIAVESLLSNNIGSNTFFPCSFVEDTVSVKCSIGSGSFEVSRLWVFGVEAWTQRPGAI